MRKVTLAAVAAAAILGSPVVACPQFPGPEVERGGPYGATMLQRARPVPPPRRHVLVPQGDLASVRVTLQRTECYGECPAYEVEISGDGSVRYHGEAFVLVSGDHRFKIEPEDVRCLVEHFRAADFWSLADVYRAPITDLPTYTLTLQIGGRTKRLEDYAGQAVGMPKVISNLEDAVDQVTGTSRWIEGDAKTLGLLRDEGFDFRTPAGSAMLAHAAARAPERLVVDLLEAGAPVAGAEPSALEAASRRGRLSVVRLLLGHGAGALPRDAGKAVLAAVTGGHAEVVETLLAYHPDLATADDEGATALLHVADAVFTASPQDQARMMRLLLAAGANPRARDNRGRTALHSIWSPELADLLIRAGADLNAVDDMGDTPLMTAADDEVALALLKAGADASIKNVLGETIAKKASRERWRKTMGWLSAHARK